MIFLPFDAPDKTFYEVHAVLFAIPISLFENTLIPIPAATPFLAFLVPDDAPS